MFLGYAMSILALRKQGLCLEDRAAVRSLHLRGMFIIKWWWWWWWRMGA